MSNKEIRYKDDSVFQWYVENKDFQRLPNMTIEEISKILIYSLGDEYKYLYKKLDEHPNKNDKRYSSVISRYDFFHIVLYPINMDDSKNRKGFGFHNFGLEFNYANKKEYSTSIFMGEFKSIKEIRKEKLIKIRKKCLIIKNIDTV